MSEPRPELPSKTAEKIMEYLEKNWFLFPIVPNRKEPPLVKWREESSSDPEKIKDWWKKWPWANIGLDCGKSGLVSIDADRRNNGLSNWQFICEEHDITTDTFQSITPSGGRHIFYRAPDGIRITNRSPWKHLGIDIRGEGGYVLLPPSKTESGIYDFYDCVDDVLPREIAAMPDVLVDLLSHNSQTESITSNETEYIEKGNRDDTLTSLAGTMRARGMTPDAIEAALLAENKLRCKPPLDESQIRKIGKSIGQKPPGKRISRNKKSSETQATKLIEFASELILFHDQNKQAMVFLEGEAVPLKSRKIKQWLARRFYLSESKPPQPDSINQALLTLEGKAIFDGPEYALYNRIAEHEGAFWYDLGYQDAIKINANGWETAEAPILFRRYTHQKAQISPVRGGDPCEISRFINIPEPEEILLLVTVISYFIPDIAHPVIHPHGPHGSGKTSLLKVVKKLCDPSNIDSIITPRNQAELAQILDHHHFCPFDNLSDLQPWMSDIFCQVCTGGGFIKRQLYSDEEDVIFQLKRCIGLNGINLVINKPDLLDRSILIYLERIDPEKRLEERDIWNRFEEAKPSILGGIFDTLSKAMAIYPELKLPHLPRMADFARWGYAIAESLGTGGDQFLQAYRANISRQNEEVIQFNSLAQSILTFMDGKEYWSGTLKKAHEELSEIAKTDNKDSTFPKSPRTIRKHLERIKANLLDYRISYTIGERGRDGYPIAFRKSKIFGAFTSPVSRLLKDKELVCEPNVNQNENDTLSTSRPMSRNDNASELREPNAANCGGLGGPDASLAEDFDERAGIMEFDGGLSREEAERAAFILAGEPT